MTARAKGRGRALLTESAGLVAVIASTVLVLGHLVAAPWGEYLLSDGDSLALPLLLQSLQQGDPFQWVMTSQLLVFPELPLYLISTGLAGGSVQGSLVVNAVVNMVVFYAGLRWLAAGVLAGRSRSLRVAAPVAATATLLLLAATEGRGLINSGAFASGILLTTYYSGVVLAAVFCLAIMSDVTGGFGATAIPGTRRRLVGLVAILAVGAAATVSNPLFALQFSAPAVVTIGLLLVLARVRPRTAGALAGVLLLGAAVGLIARLPAQRLIAVEASTYLHLERAGAAVDGFILQMRVVGSAGSGKIELAVVALLIVCAAATVVVAIATQTRAPGRLSVSTAGTAVALFVLVASVSLLLGVVVTGSLVSRYLLPLAAFPVLLVVPLAGDFVPRGLGARFRGSRPAWIGAGAPLAVALTAAVVAVLLAAPPVAAASERAGSTPESRCLEDWLGGRTLAGVGSFWTTRPLDLYAAASTDVQQVNFDFSAQLWMNNIADYRGKSFSYVLVDHEPDWSVLARGTLGEPGSVTACPTFDIYDYAGTDGRAVLDRIVSESIEKASDDRGY
ncbi:MULTISPECIES: hypothetical protein [unclassified Rathayibacter]|uniref:hypothetical protein n=1 Tax=unclassified Rathayibacter TaxID=2609250 RepID=UPI0006FA6B77|nr:MULTISPECIES: hypothetical protein [unclassified Rathayibacter]KQP97599.1 hypothetical protein ASF42_18170 [Rathayibacter sp. Leaf294]KQS07271.1 hypothetical protein ASG06_18905 [Rathayibacter sp. Leaf185]